uniref:T-complex protein 1 subunit theta n=1 Tax=Strigamia maritima TaxID=126957 RepID=T1JMI0_STRMM
MALHVPKAPGFAQMLKDGSKHFSGLDEAVYRNITACKELAQTTRSAYGPRGMNKMVINHIEKLFVTNDAATIIKELDVIHPAAKMVIFGSNMQEHEIGDGTNFVIIFAGALLQTAEDLLRMGLSPGEVADGYELALKKALEILPTLTCYEVKRMVESEVSKGIHAAVMSKQYGIEDFLAPLITHACVSILPKEGVFNVDNVRVCKILGSGVLKSEVVSGMVFKREVEGDFQKVSKAKVAIYSCAVDSLQTETKGTVLIHTAQELLNYSKGEENILEQQIKGIAESGCTVIVSGGKFGEMAMHFLNKYKIMAVRVMSKFDLRRLCKTVGATVLPKLLPPTPEEMGYCDQVYVDEVGETAIVVFKQGECYNCFLFIHESESIPDKDESRISTVVIRGSTDNLMDDIERAVNDGVNTFKVLHRDGRLVPGAGATEIELAKQISTFGETCPGLEQYAIKSFATALEMLPKTLAENAGLKTTEMLSKLYAMHNEGKGNYGVDIGNETTMVKDVTEDDIYDLYLGKYWGMKYATSAACTILKVDQIIMAKPAGGPKPRDNPNKDDD